MSNSDYRYCPKCGRPLEKATRNQIERSLCPDSGCGYVHWDNPIPVVAIIAEREDKVILVRSIGWPESWFGLVTGFIEKGERPEEAALREVREELGLGGELGDFIGSYPFFPMNQLILAYHLLLEPGEIVLDSSELNACREIPIDKLRPWDSGTGLALQDWLRSRGFDREAFSFG